MEIVKLEELLNINFNVVFINSLKQFWHTTKSFQCIGKPKKQNLFLYLYGCKITYTDKNGKTYNAGDGDVVYVPIGSEYKAELYDFKDEKSHTIGINFFTLNENNENVVFSDNIKVFSSVLSVKNLFNQSILFSSENSLISNRIILYEILNKLNYKNKAISPLVVNSVKYLEENIENNITIRKLAKYCNVSEVYLRKEFKKFLNKSPVQYRNELKLKKAQNYLEFGDISVQEISDTLGYATVSHFIKEFKAYYGCSPLKYRNTTKKEN